MTSMSRRAVIRASLTAAAVGALARPFMANAAASTAVVWAGQGFIPEEDVAFRKTVADYEKASGNKIDLSIMPFTALNQKAIAALTSGDVPDLIFHGAPETILPQNAWDNKLVDMSDVVDVHKSELSETALLCSSFYNSTEKRRSFYLAPIKQGCAPFHIWADLVEKAGFKLSDAPKTWDAFWDFFKPMQKVLRSQGMRRMYALGLQITTVGPNDGNGLMAHFMSANGGADIVTRDGRLHTDDPRVREAAIRSVEYMTNCYKQGYVPPEALSWNDADDNNGFHEKLFLMDFDGTLSTELAMIKDKKAFADIVTMGLPNGNDGKPMPAQVGAGGGFIARGAKNIAVAKDFMQYFMQPAVMNENLKGGLGRWVPVIPQIVKDDPFWLDTKEDPHRAPYVQEAVLGPTFPSYNGFNPAWGQVSAEQLWGQAHADVIKNGMTAQAAVDKAFKRAEAIFSKYTFG
jgi:multiple sugar transport system substrate-binding protein